MDYQVFSAKSVDDAITEACKALSVTSDKLEYEIVDEGSSGFLGFLRFSGFLIVPGLRGIPGRLSFGVGLEETIFFF